MPFRATPFEGLFLFEPTIFEDKRGFFYESFNQRSFEQQTGVSTVFVQDNQSFSHYGVIRGLHFQVAQSEQAKLVRVLSGTVLDVVLDLRPASKTFGKVYSVVLSAQNRLQLFVPKGFAHGFSALSPQVEFSYKCDNFYSKQHEQGIHYADPALAIDWQVPQQQAIVSEKDAQLPTFAEWLSQRT